MWDGIKGRLLSFLLPVAISIVNWAIDKYLPQAKDRIREFFQGEFDEAVIENNLIYQAVIVNIIAKILGFEILVGLTPEVTLALKVKAREILEEACESVKDKFVDEYEEEKEWWMEGNEG